MTEFSEVSLVVAFTSFNAYTAQIDRLDDAVVAGVMDDYYALAGSAIRGAGGRVVKFIGDATLCVFPPDQADRAILELLELKNAADAFMTKRGWDCRLVVKVHFGPVAAGEFGAGADRRYDVLGKTVNVAVRLEASGGVDLSAEAFRCLGPEARTRFKKHTPPITYIRQADAHRSRWSKRS
ncbi:MAG TPA: adenylate/guanylate cyclase domain-containing protein [Thermoanaerobaculia bacterium]|nr:adenylate/guanylate cyclase domain-containing protein [Thermoanaerobaculia bacterium]